MINCCIILPFYNNHKTVGGVIDSLYSAGYKIIAVCDGATDGSLHQARKRKAKLVELICCEKNRGKGFALVQGFKAASRQGFDYAVTCDADGQHTLNSINALVAAAEIDCLSNSILIGSRTIRGNGAPSKFANRFSNFWLKVQTLQSLPDTQSGCRLYSVEKIAGRRWFSNRYEFETEVLVRSAWSGVKLLAVPVEVLYPEDRITHFRPVRDFVRISFLNSLLTLAALFYGYPKMLIHKWRDSY